MSRTLRGSLNLYLDPHVQGTEGITLDLYLNPMSNTLIRKSLDLYRDPHVQDAKYRRLLNLYCTLQQPPKPSSRTPRIADLVRHYRYRRYRHR